MLSELCEGEVCVTFNNNLGNDSEWFAGYSLEDAFAGQSSQNLLYMNRMQQHIYMEYLS